MDKASGATQFGCDFAYGTSLGAQAGNVSGVHGCPWPAEFPTFGTGRTNPGPDALLYQRPLELGHRPDDLEHEPPGGCGQVKVVPEAHERDAEGLELSQRVD